jgi:DNA-binding response OmpR family regulator
MSRKKVLLVDDEKDYREILAQTLKRRGYEVAACEDGETALARLPEFAPDIVLLDVNMPGIDGFEVCRRIRSDPKFGTVPILMITVQSGDEDTVQGLSIGADGYLAKPFSSEELLARIGALLR